MRKRRRKAWQAALGILAVCVAGGFLFSASARVSYEVQLTSVEEEGPEGHELGLRAFLPSLRSWWRGDGPCAQPRPEPPSVPRCETIHVAIVCGGLESTRRVATLLKSLLFHRRHPLHLHLVLDSPRTKLVLQSLFDSWALPAVNISLYSIRSVEADVSWIPNRHYSGMFGLLKLTLPSVLPKHLRRVLVLDTDVLFVSDVSELWRKWRDFNASQALGLVENLSSWYLGKLWKAHDPWPAIGRGFNTGVILMDLERLRRLGWLGLWRSVAKAQLALLGSTALADQDIFNAVLKERPELVLSLPCEWNLQLGEHSEQALCAADVQDLRIVHWNSPQKTAVRSTHAEFFRRHYETFVEMDGNLLRREAIRCPSATAPPPGPAPDEADGEPCEEFHQAGRIRYRTHLYFAPDYAYEAKAEDVALVAALSMDRLQMLLGLAEKWEGPLSVALYASDAEARHFLALAAEAPQLRGRKDLALHLVYKQGAFFPVNFLRNVALQFAETQHVFLSDIDFLPAFGLYDSLRQAVGGQGDMALKALVVPAFQTQRYKFSFPRSKAELLNGLDSGELAVFRADVWAKGQAGTDYEKWRTATQPYAVGWRPDFEPYVVVQREGLPFYDPRFLGFGWNKVSHIMELDALGFDFLVLPNAFAVHLPHAPSLEIAKYRSSPLYRKCLKALKGEFIKDLAKKYHSRQAVRIQPLQGDQA